jgi:thiosulfate reductase cytochrome b subunit
MDLDLLPHTNRMRVSLPYFAVLLVLSALVATGFFFYYSFAADYGSDIPDGRIEKSLVSYNASVISLLFIIAFCNVYSCFRFSL